MCANLFLLFINQVGIVLLLFYEDSNIECRRIREYLIRRIRKPHNSKFLVRYSLFITWLNESIILT